MSRDTMERQQKRELENNEDQYRRPSCKPANGNDEQAESISPGAAQILRMLDTIAV